MSAIHPTAIVAPDARIGAGTEVGPYAIIEAGAVLGANNKIWAHAFIGRGTTMGDGNQVHPHAVIGHEPQDLKFDPATATFTRIGDGNTFREHSSVHRATKAGGATVIGSGCLLMANAHVAHDCQVGDKVIMVNNASITGHCEVGDGVIMSGMTGIHQFCRIGRLVMFSALSATNKDLPPFMVFGGRPAVAQGLNLVGLRRNGVGPDARKQLKQAYRLLYREGLPITEALEAISALSRQTGVDELRELVDFVGQSKRGINLGVEDGGDTLRPIKKKGAARHGAKEIDS